VWAAPLAIAAAALAFPGCSRPAPPASTPDITLHASPNPAEASYVEVRGLSPSDLSAIRTAHFDFAGWSALLKVSVGEGEPDADVPPVQGRYALSTESITFTPIFPFSAGRAYRVAFDPARVPGTRTGALREVVAVVRVPAGETAPATEVVAVYPSADVVPENLLRMYVEFSAPMGNGVARDYVRILDAGGRDVAIPFLPVDADFWNPDHTRITVFFDPGRVKQGIRPNLELGRPLKAGRQYTLEISAEWRDAGHRPLKQAYRRTFRVGSPRDRAIVLSSWRVQPPAAGTRAPLVVVFPAPLDHALASRAIAVETAGRRPVNGDVVLGAADTEWRFTPVAPWQEGDYNLAASSILEDPSGNRIASPFEAVGNSKGRQAPDEYRVTFRIGRAAAYREIWSSTSSFGG
jgi:hypothetical protein